MTSQNLPTVNNSCIVFGALHWDPDTFYLLFVGPDIMDTKIL